MIPAVALQTTVYVTCVCVFMLHICAMCVWVCVGVCEKGFQINIVQTWATIIQPSAVYYSYTECESFLLLSTQHMLINKTGCTCLHGLGVLTTNNQCH